MAKKFNGNGRSTASEKKPRSLSIGRKSTVTANKSTTNLSEHRPQMLPRMLERFVRIDTSLNLDKIRLEAMRTWADHRYILIQIIVGQIPAKVSDRIRALDQLRAVGIPTRIDAVPWTGDLSTFTDHELDRLAHGETPTQVLADRNGA